MDPTPPDGASSHDLWSDLTFGDLESWVGGRSLSRGRSYQQRRRVLLLACSPRGELSAQIVGTQLYVTRVVRSAAGALSSVCSCPLGGNCKHGVAAVLEYLERVKAGKEIPCELPGPALHALDVTTDDDHVPDDDGDTEDEEPTPRPKSTGGSARRKKPGVAAYLEKLTAPELVALVLELARTSPEIDRLLKSRAALASGEVETVVRSFRAELARASAKPGWSRHWEGKSYTPDYSRVTQHLEQLLAAGQADLVLQLGLEVMTAGTKQVEMSDDEGETESAVCGALEPVWQALDRSSLSPPERIIWLYDRYDEDEYNLCEGAGEGADIWEVDAAAWNEVAEAMLARLASGDLQSAGARDHDSRYRRDLVVGRAIDALEEAGRDAEALDLALREVRVTDSYERAVDMLDRAGRQEEARLLAMEGIRQTETRLPGIAAHLRDRLRGLAGKGGDLALEAAFIAEEFLMRPSLAGYQKLREAAQRVDLWDTVREQTLAALQTGSSPLARTDWPLPVTGTSPGPEQRGAGGPDRMLLTQIAIEEGDHAAALKWYRETHPRGSAWGGDILGEAVALAVAESYPDESIAIWKTLTERQILRGDRSGYEASLQYLRPMQRLLMQLERQAEWEAYLLALQTENHRRRALLETLDRLKDRPIIGN
jgi:uncharacterized Zn finger protein